LLLPTETIAQKSRRKTRQTITTATERQTARNDDAAIGRAFANGTSDIQVEGKGTVSTGCTMTHKVSMSLAG